MGLVLNHPLAIDRQWELNRGDRVEGVRMSCGVCACHTMIEPDSPLTPRCSNCFGYELTPVPPSKADVQAGSRRRLPGRWRSGWLA
jgi:hypothetical protein